MSLLYKLFFSLLTSFLLFSGCAVQRVAHPLPAGKLQVGTNSCLNSGFVFQSCCHHGYPLFLPVWEPYVRAGVGKGWSLDISSAGLGAQKTFNLIKNDDFAVFASFIPFMEDVLHPIPTSLGAVYTFGEPWRHVQSTQEQKQRILWRGKSTTSLSIYGISTSTASERLFSPALGLSLSRRISIYKENPFSAAYISGHILLWQGSDIHDKWKIYAAPYVFVGIQLGL